MVLHLIASATASSSATLEFTSGIDSTFNEYEFQFVNIHPSADDKQFQFQVNAVGASGFNETITSSAYYAYHNENDSSYTFAYRTNADQAQGTGYQAAIGYNMGYDADQSASGKLTLFDPSNTTFVKHFTSQGVVAVYNDIAASLFTAGYINVTAAIDEISFKFNSGNIDAGTIYMYGVGL
jgi:hypothetical protein